jgi:hypothetical protein
VGDILENDTVLGTVEIEEGIGREHLWREKPEKLKAES